MSKLPEHTVNLARLAGLRAAAAAAGLDALAIVPGANLSYLSGLDFHLSERPTLLVVPVAGPPWFVVPALELTKAHGLPFDATFFPWPDETGYTSAFREAIAAAGEIRRLGIEGRRMRWLELEALRQAGLAAEIVGADAVFASLRMRKDEEELGHMRAAVAIAQEAFTRTLPAMRAGVSEREVAAELTLQLLRGGSGHLPFGPIVATGEHGANPHAVPDERPLAPGDLVTIDWGATVAGYASDITRCVHVGGAQMPERLGEVYEVVRAANAAGRAAAGPGTTGDAVDRATRAVIEQAGLGEYFVHRTGHGLGLETHEEPDMKSGDLTQLAAGMTFTVEPGVYIPGLGGCRVEDDVVITEDGAESLTTLTRELVTVGEE
jgi:Xaa-Pro dipeptidase